jgi:uncharacterized protein
MRARLNYIELPVSDIAGSKAFFEAAFGWNLTDFGPAYAATTNDETDLGLDASATSVGAPLAVIEVDDIDAALVAVESAGGVITQAVFSFPGGRRFHAREPSGNELGIWQRTQADH